MFIKRMQKRKKLIFKILLNYLILFICVTGFRGGGVLALILPALQICLSWLNYCNTPKWQTVFMLEVHLFISTVLGLYLEGYLESVLVFQTIWKIGAALVFCFGVITTLLKYFLIKKPHPKEKNRAIVQGNGNTFLKRE